MRKTNLYLTDRQLTILRKEAAKLGISTAEFIRRILDTYIENMATR